MSVSAIEIGIPKEVIGHPPRILVVEDEPGIAEIVDMVLQADGCEVTCCGSGEEALDKAEGTTFEVATIDLNLPGINGFDVSKRLKQKSNPPTIILTTAQFVTQEELEESEIDDYISKPFDLDRFLNVVRNGCRSFFERQQKNQESIVFQAS